MTSAMKSWTRGTNWRKSNYGAARGTALDILHKSKVLENNSNRKKGFANDILTDLTNMNEF
jgi:hypothetical protein